VGKSNEGRRKREKGGMKEKGEKKVKEKEKRSQIER
jgi:hypothetical protein